MDIRLEKASQDQKALLNNLMEFYCYDFSELLHTDVDGDGLFKYKYLDQYWTEEGRHPYFILVDGRYAGFVLINQHFLVLEAENGHSIAEFFVMRKYRRRGIGQQIAQKAYELFPGPWEVSVVEFHKDAVAFWERTIKNYTRNRYKLHSKEYKDKVRKIFIFNTDDGAK